MSSLYAEAHRALQDAFDTRPLADTLEARVMRRALTPSDQAFIAASDFFFLSTVDHDGFPTVSYKGGAPGFVRVVDPQTLAFPLYDGNGMFLSAGNMQARAKTGLLFIDMEKPRRLRLHGLASLHRDDPLLADYHEALMIVRIALTTIFPNCPRYIHSHDRVAASDYVPRPGCETPVPEWKRVDFLQDALPPEDRARAERSGPRIPSS